MFNNPPPSQTPVDTNGQAISFSWQQWFSQLFSFSKNIVDFTASSVNVMVNGFTLQIEDNAQVVTIDPAGALATGTIVFPVTPYNGQYLTVSSTFAIAALTVSSSGSETIKNKPTAMAAGIGFSYYYRSTNTTWYRLS